MRWEENDTIMGTKKRIQYSWGYGVIVIWGEILTYWKEYSLQRVLTDWQKDLTFPYFVDFEEKIAKKN